MTDVEALYNIVECMPWSQQRFTSCFLFWISGDCLSANEKENKALRSNDPSQVYIHSVGLSCVL